MLLSLPFGVPASAALDLLGGLVCVALDCTPFGLGTRVSCVALSLPKASAVFDDSQCKHWFVYFK